MIPSGTVIGRYEIFEPVGRGGNATVYRARQIDLERTVAVKELASFHAGDTDAAARFLRESRITASLSHPCLVTVHEYFQNDGIPYIAMEFLSRGSLEDTARDLNLAQVARVLEQTLSGLDHAHERGVVHRDLKPSNLMVTESGAVKVADFGIAKALNEALPGGHRTATGTTVGTPAYMAPEQARGLKVEPATDLYAVGVIAYEMLLRRVPFEATDTPVAVLLQHVNDPPPSPLSIDPTLDPELAGWLEWMLKKDPADRPASAREAWEALEEHVIRILGPRWRRSSALPAPGGAPVAPSVSPPPMFVGDPEAEEGQAGDETTAGTAAGIEETGDTSVAEPIAANAPAESAPDAIGETRPGDGFATFRGAPPMEDAVPSPDATEAVGEVSEAPTPSADGFATYRPQTVPEPAPAEEPRAEAPPPHPETAAWPAAEGTSADEDRPSNETMPPTSIAAREPEPRPTHDGGRGGRGGRRVGLLVGGGAAAVAAIAAVAILGLGGGSGGDRAADPPDTTTAAETPSMPDADLGALLADRPGLAATSAARFIADPAGRIRRVGSDPAVVTDPLEPRAAAVLGDSLLISDAEGLTRYSLRDLVQTAVYPLNGANAISVAARGAAGAAASDGGRGRACRLTAKGLGPCASLGFVPGGLAASGDDLLVSDTEGGRVVLLRSQGDRLVRSATDVGPSPRAIAVRGPTAYVAIERGVVPLTSGKPAGDVVITTSTSPSDLAVPTDGLKVFAALPASKAVAVIDTSTAVPTVTEVAVPGAPERLAVAGQTVYVLLPGSSRIVRMNARTGALQNDSDAVPSGGQKPSRVTLGRASGTQDGRVLTITLPLTGGSVRPQAVRATDSDISNGGASLELWQPGIATSAPREVVGGVAVGTTARPGRALVTLTAEAGRFERMTVQPAESGSAIRIELTEPPVVAGPSPDPNPNPGGNPGPKIVPPNCPPVCG